MIMKVGEWYRLKPKELLMEILEHYKDDEWNMYILGLCNKPIRCDKIEWNDSLAAQMYKRDADIVISLPKIKSHQKTGITGAIKNLVGINIFNILIFPLLLLFFYGSGPNFHC